MREPKNARVGLKILTDSDGWKLYFGELLEYLFKSLVPSKTFIKNVFQ